MSAPCAAWDSMINADRESAFVIHSRSYTDSRMLLDLLTQHFGLVRVVYRPPRKKNLALKPQAFTPFFACFTGKTELKTLRQLEASGNLLLHSGRRLYCGLYVNELILRIISTDDPHPALFLAYFQCISKLASSADGMEDLVLRTFELTLLSELGYGVNFDEDLQGAPIICDQDYEFIPAQGFKLLSHESRSEVLRCTGAEIMAMQQGDFSSVNCRRAAKALCRSALKPLLGPKPLQSVELFK